MPNNLHLEPGHLLDDLIALGLNLPREDRYFHLPQSNRLRPLLEDLADCYRAALKNQVEHKSALVNGRKVYAESTETPAQARAVSDNAAHG